MNTAPGNSEVLERANKFGGTNNLTFESNSRREQYAVFSAKSKYVCNVSHSTPRKHTFWVVSLTKMPLDTGTHGRFVLLLLDSTTETIMNEFTFY